MVQNEELINRIVNISLAAFVCDSTDDPEDVGGIVVISAAKFLNALTDEEARHIIRDVVIDTVSILIDELKKLQ